MRKTTDKIALGCVTFGREINKETAFAIMDYAVSNGITFFDTAAAYGNGASERVIGEWLSNNGGIGDRLTIATKLLPPFSQQSLVDGIDKSLYRLNTASVNILYLHNWHETALNDDVILELNRLLQIGITKAIGVSNFTSDQLKIFLDKQRLSQSEIIGYVQNNHNLAVSDLADEMVDHCSINGIKIISYSPLGAGFLTGKHLSGVETGSRFDMMPAHQKIYFTQDSEKRLEGLLKLAKQAYQSPSVLALAWALRQPFVEKVLIGARSIDHINQAIKADEFTDYEILKKLDELSKTN